MTVIKGTKMNMTQLFQEDGSVVPVTVIMTDDSLSPELEGAEVDVIGTSKGKGFTGVMKRWGFHGGPATRGQGLKPRAPGAIGSQTPGRVFKGKKMAGRAGGKRITVKSLNIVKVMPSEKKFMVSGPIPGHRNGAITVKVYEN